MPPPSLGSLSSVKGRAPDSSGAARLSANYSRSLPRTGIFVALLLITASHGEAG